MSISPPRKALYFTLVSVIFTQLIFSRVTFSAFHQLGLRTVVMVFSRTQSVM